MNTVSKNARRRKRGEESLLHPPLPPREHECREYCACFCVCGDSFCFVRVCRKNFFSYNKKDLRRCMSTCSCLLCVSLTLLLLFFFLFFFLCNSSPNESLEHVNRPVSEFLQRTLLSFFFFAAEIPTFFVERFLHRCWIIYTLRHLQSSDSRD